MEIYGNYSETLFRNETTGYTIFRFKLNNFIPEFDDINVICKGIFSYSLICSPLKLIGEKVTDNYGDSFNVTEFVPAVENEKSAINFLSSACFKGISEKIAEKVIKTIGLNLFEFAQSANAYARLTEIEGIGPGKAKTIINTLIQANQQKQLFDYINKFGGSFINAEKIVIKYGVNAIRALKENPYKVGAICDVPFITCDLIAKDNNFSEFNTERITAIINYVVKKDYEKGNVYITVERLYKNVDYISRRKSAFTGSKISPYQIVCLCDNSENIISEIVDGEIRLYYKPAFVNEIQIAKNIKRFQRNKISNKISIKNIIKECEKDLGIVYSDKQKDCFKFLTSTGIKIITGGPGTGKSTVINGLTYAYHKLYPDNKIVMMAPTGRAAQRINEITGHEAGTIHRMLNICPFSDKFIQSDYCADYPADLIIVDESSMIDEELMSLLTESIKNNATIILVGDIDQLPSIGAGSVLRDIINANISTVKLDVNYRQKGKSTIIDNAININDSSADLIIDDTFKINKFSSAEEIASCAKSLFLKKYNSTNPFSVQILCPQLKGKSGIRTLNNIIQDELISTKCVIAHGFNKFKIGDKVMAMQNNYEIGYFNGDVGIIKEVSDVNFTVKFNKNSIMIPREKIEDFQLAYACTIHKSQGSEFDSIIICLPYESMSMINKNLLYTAVTRAKKEVIILTQNGCIEYAVTKIITDKRISGLTEKITKNIKEVA